MVAVDADVSSGVILKIEGYERALFYYKKSIKNTYDLSNLHVYSIVTLLLIK